MPVKTQHPDYKKNYPKWKRCRDVAAGQDEVHAAGEIYLPKLEEEILSAYKARLMRSTFYNATWRTIAGLNGMLFRKSPERKLPSAIDDLLTDVTMKGVPLDVFAQSTANEVLTVGRVGILVDHPPAPASENKVVTMAAAQEIGLRPTLQLYKAEEVINWKFRKIGNKWVLCLLVLTEEHTIPKDEFEDKCEVRYRVLDLDELNLYRQRLFRSTDGGQDELVEGPTYPLMDGKAMSYIPFVFVGPDGTEATVEVPPLIDLVDLNLAHYRVTADYEHGCHFTGLPTPWVSGYKAATDEKGVVTEKLYVGSHAALVFPDPQAKCGYMEFTGQGLDALKSNLDAKKEEMAALGSKILHSSKSGVEAFKTVAIQNVGETSVLASISIAVSLGLKKALEIFSLWAGAGDTDIEYDLNRDFLPVSMDAPTLTAYMAMWQGGAISDVEIFALLKRGDVIDGEKSYEDHQTEIDNSTPPKPLAPVGIGPKPPSNKQGIGGNA
jgi:hypothetical protein